MLRIKYKNTFVDGQFLTILQTKSQPFIEYNFDPNKIYTLIMYDPDTPFGDYVHWFIVNIKNNISNGITIMQYKGPSPPKDTGIHRYIFLLFEQSGIINYLDLEKIERNTQLKIILNKLDINLMPITKKYFTSKYQNGGYRSRNSYKKNKTIRRKKKLYK